MQNRDFKGVWIPKEIWLNKDLTLLEMVIFVEIDSLDNEDNCVAGNEYFADFCGCSESKVSKAIKKLQELNMIEIISFDGRHRKLRVVKSTRQSSKKYEADSQNLRPNNIVNNKNNKTISKDIVAETTSCQIGETKKLNLYQKCIAMIEDYTENETLRKYLTDFLKICLENSREGSKPFYTNHWKSKLTKLSELSDNEDMQIKIVKQTLDNGWANFYAYKDGGRRTGDFAKDVEHLTEGLNSRAERRDSSGEKF